MTVNLRFPLTLLEVTDERLLLELQVNKFAIMEMSICTRQFVRSVIHVMHLRCHKFGDKIVQRRANGHIQQSRSMVRTHVRSHTNVPL